MAQDEPSGTPPFAKARALAGVFMFVLVGLLAVIDAMSAQYVLELGPMGLMLGTGTVLLGVEISALLSRMARGQ